MLRPRGVPLRPRAFSCSAQVLIPALALALAACNSAAATHNEPILSPLGEPQVRWQEWAPDAVIYHVYPRSFKDSNGDGRGDLKGLAEKLDYLQGLGINTLLLMPLVANEDPVSCAVACGDGTGGYAPTDLNAVDSSYGVRTPQGLFSPYSLRQLIDAAHSRGMRLLLDMPMDTLSVYHPYFKDVAAGNDTYKSYFPIAPKVDGQCPMVKSIESFSRPDQPPTSSWRAFSELTKAPDYPEVRRPNECYWSKLHYLVAEWNWHSDDVVAMWREVLLGYLAEGVDGFRFDSAPAWADQTLTWSESPLRIMDDYSDRTMAAMKALIDAINESYPHALVIAEANTSRWEDIDRMMRQTGLHMAHAYPLYHSLLASVDGGTAAPLRASANEAYATRDLGWRTQVFIGNHDMHERRGVSGRVRSITRYGPLWDAVTTLGLFLPGVPSIYYGDEIGMAEAPLVPGRQQLSVRNLMAWDRSNTSCGFTGGPSTWTGANPSCEVNVAAQLGDPLSTLGQYTAKIAVRREQAALRGGAYGAVASADAGVYAFLRWNPGGPAPTAGGNTVLVVANLNREVPRQARLNLGPGSTWSWQRATFTSLRTGQTFRLTPENSGAFSPGGAIPPGGSDYFLVSDLVKLAGAP